MKLNDKADRNAASDFQFVIRALPRFRSSGLLGGIMADNVLQRDVNRGKIVPKRLTKHAEKNTPLDGRVAEYLSLGCSVANFGNAKLPTGYAVLLNADESHYFWLCADGRESVIHWDRWAAFRGAKEDFERRNNDAASRMFEDEICG